MGDAGIGKSRLVWEFRQRVAGEAVACVVGHCVPQGGTIPYLPVLDVLREHAALSEGIPWGRQSNDCQRRAGRPGSILVRDCPSSYVFWGSAIAGEDSTT